MQIKDARSLPSIAQEDLRYKAVAAVVKGMTQTEAAEVFNVSRYSVFKWTKAYASGGKVALRSRMRGRPAVSKLKGYETGMRSDHQAGTTWAPCGHTPVVSCTGKRFRTNMISSITNRGKLAFRIYRCTFTAELFIDFLERLMKYKRQKVFVIVDGHPVHKSEAVQNWVKTNKSRIEMFFMPGYSPDDERQLDLRYNDNYT